MKSWLQHMSAGWPSAGVSLSLCKAVIISACGARYPLERMYKKGPTEQLPYSWDSVSVAAAAAAAVIITRGPAHEIDVRVQSLGPIFPGYPQSGSQLSTQPMLAPIASD